jgi:soluble lytic murein transglycosylase
MDAEQLATQLERSEFASLRHVSFQRHRLEEIERLGPDASYAAGLIYLELGIEDIGERLLRLAYERAPRPWGEEAFVELATLLREQERYGELGQLAESAIDRGMTLDSAAGFHSELALLESMYEQDRFGDLEARLLRVLPAIQRAFAPADPRVQEATLWWVVGRIELDRPDWPEAVRALYRAFPASSVHSRLWVYLINRTGLLEPFSERETAFFRAKQLQSEGEADEATTILIELADLNDELVISQWGMLELYRAAARSGRQRPAAEALRRVADVAEPVVARRAYEYAGRLYRLVGAYTAAEQLLQRSLELRSSGREAERVRWYILSSQIRRDPVSAARELAARAPSFSSPEYYSDALFELAGLLGERRRWDALLQAYQAIVDVATPGVRARYELAIARALETGALSAAPGRAAELRERYLERAAGQRENLFAALVAATLLGRDGVESLGITDPPGGEARGASSAHADAEPRTSPDSAAAYSEESRHAVLASTYLRYGLTERLYEQVRGVADGIDPTLMRESAERLAGAGMIREAVLALNHLETAGGTLTREVARLRYPLGYAAIIDGRVAAESVDRSVFYALIREESLFDPEIGSVAGAIGLAQLIPSTAEDIARRMDRDAPVLTDPADNLAIGARYFAMLTEQFGTIARALAAYNGGQGNVRRWERRNPLSDEILFHQTIPFPETYNHVRKVVVSASYYGYLYAGRSPAETVRLIFALDSENS